MLDLLVGLVDRSLVAVEDEAGVSRYQLLETLRDYGRERLAASGQATGVRDRHLEWCVGVAEQGERDIWKMDQLAAIKRVELEHDNLRAGLSWALARGGDPDPGLRVAAASSRFWDTRGDIREAIQWLERLMAMPGLRRYTVSWARAMTALGYLTAVRGDAARSIALLDEILVVLRRVGDPRALAVALFFRAIAVGWTSGDPSAVPLLEQGLQQARQRGPRWAVYFCMIGLGEAARVQGDHARAEALLNESLALTRSGRRSLGPRFCAQQPEPGRACQR